MPRIDLNILNQLQTPAFYASSLATRPAASFVGRIFIDSDSPSTGLYRDTGTAWVQIADPGAGTTGTLQQVTTNGNSTTTGITITTNGLGIGTTIPGSNRLDIHSSSGINATFNGTGTTNAALQLQLAGVGKWNLSNFYNAAANDFIITDVLNTLNRLTIKNTGQTFIGTDVTSSGAFVVNNATSDNHIVCIGANGPSIRLRNTGTAPTLNAGFGISTATNNFIQGSASGNYCIFNSSTTASPILFGIYDAGTGNTQEAARISAARNLLVGTVTDSGYKLSVIGTANITTQIITPQYQFTSTISFASQTSGNNNIYSGLASLIISDSTGAITLFSIDNSTGSGIFKGSVTANKLASKADGFFLTNTALTANASQVIVIYNSVGTRRGYVGYGSSGDNTFSIANETGGRILITGTLEISNAVTASVLNTVTNKISIIVGGVQYYLLASTSAV